VRVGNDIVDLGGPAIDRLHARFIERVCTAEEQRAIAESPDPKRRLWTLFAAKEAAYKAAVKLGLDPGFAHRRFVVSSDLDRVDFGEHTFALRVIDGEDWVHAIVGDATITGVERGESAREPLLRALGMTHLGIEREPRAGSWDGFGPPRVAGAPEVDVSLSHDGRFAAFAASVP
jgi:phosphopantetheinyl transferase (holo-ACP synthase)